MKKFIKGRFSKAAVMILAAVLLLASFPFFAGSVYQAAGRLDELQNQLDKTNDEKDALKQEAKNLADYMKTLNHQLDKTGKELDEISEKTAKLESKIDDKLAEIELATQQIDNQYEAMKLRIKFLYEMGETDYIEAFLTTESFSDFVAKADYISELMRYDRAQLEAMAEGKEKLEAKKEALSVQLTEVNKLKEEAEAKRAELNETLNNSKDTFNAFSDQIAEFEKQAIEYERQIEAEKLASQTRNDSGSAEDINYSYVPKGDDEKLLATIIYCEAGGQPYAGKKAVASVVINRVNSKRFAASTVYDVIMSPGQFSPVASGRFAMAYAQGVPQECYKAARDVIKNGVTGGWLFFIRDDGVRKGDVIGDHVFFYEW